MLTENQKNELKKKTCKVLKSKESFKAEMAKRFSSSDIEKMEEEIKQSLKKSEELSSRLTSANEAVAVVQLRQDGSWVPGEGLWRWEDGIDPRDSLFLNKGS